MSDLKFCPDCGAKLLPDDRFCGDCGFDTQSIDTEGSSQSPQQQTTAVPSQPSSQGPTTTASSPAAIPSQLAAQTPPSAAVIPPVATRTAAPPPPPASGPPMTPSRNSGPTTGELGRGSGGSKNALIIMIALLAVLFLGGGGVYWWLSRGEKPDPGSAPPLGTQNNQPTVPVQSGSVEQPASNPAPVPAPAVDLSRAATYLSEPGLKCTFFVNYPDGTAGVVERTSAKVVSHPAVRVSEVETGVEQGEAFGYGFHYVERPDGTYYILDQTPDELFPVLKNNLTVGQTWNYQDESGKITWTVMDMGVNLDLGYTVIENCLIVYEDNKMVDYQSLTYYAPGRGMVAVRNPNGKDDFYKLTAITKIDVEQAATVVKKWSPNYAIIKDDRTQS